MKKGVIYTCISGDYDFLYDHKHTNPDWNYICFSNTVKPSLKNKSWKILPLKYEELDQTRNSRWHKINAHKLFTGYEKSVWIDANIDVTSKAFFDEVNQITQGLQTFAIMNHPARDCIYQEIEACKQLKLDDDSIMDRQIEIYKNENYPNNNGLYASSIIYRNHLDNKLDPIMEEWWSWVSQYSKRDQLSLPYVLHKNGVKPALFSFIYTHGPSGPLYFYPHISNSRERIRQLYGTIHELETTVNELSRKISSTNKYTDLKQKTRFFKSKFPRK